MERALAAPATRLALRDLRLLREPSQGRISSPRYVSAISTEAVESHPQVATATLLAPAVRGRNALLRWQGDLAADAFDLELKRPSSPWRTILSASCSTSERIHGQRGGRFSIRVRARDVYGDAGPWSAERTLRFGGG